MPTLASELLPLLSPLLDLARLLRRCVPARSTRFATFRRDGRIQASANTISIGDSARGKRYPFLEAVPNGSIVLDDRTHGGFLSRIDATGRAIFTGSDVFLADHVYISDTAHDHLHIDLPISQQGLSHGREVVDDDGAWIGIGAVTSGNV